MEIEYRATNDLEGAVASTMELVLRARLRTSEELNSLSSGNSASYAAAIAGNTPHVALPNGVTIVMRKCTTWSC